MKCPACTRRLTPLECQGVMLDACQRGCGGVWFDAAELAQVNDLNRKSGHNLQLTRDESIKVDDSQPRHCPVCSKTKLVRRLFSLGTGVEMDCCPKCEGIWLDFGELETIQQETNPQPQPVRHVVKRQAASLAITFGVIEQVQAQQVMIRKQTPRTPR
ncbi:MAG: zf-TFIIB domain-containing protein [Verrucomicrobiota bacterium]